MGPLNFARPPARVTHGSQQLVPLTWVQARMMDLAGSTDRDPVTALLQVLLRPRRSPADLRIIYWNAGGISDSYQTYARSSSRRIHVLLGETKPEQQLRQFLCVPPRRGIAPRDRFQHRGTGARHRPRRTGAAGVHRYKIWGGCEADLPPHFCSSDFHTIFDDSTPTILAGDLNASTLPGARGSSRRPVDNCCRLWNNMGMRSWDQTHHHTSRPPI
ncbi:hypothetical protein EVAR_66087_1 [Eumeta japonica]|uniref:Endonuclease/exonuclease/phosphatase domain-containing protein n=1 Tax=Eumeta variegata TaxID=151549 RepID=A0A4C1ZXZ7_EUMVA|nr:hypothetical protein EVAR_66087_1 [Eumeta japonica]